jgi:hypothetical protein
MSLEGDLLMPPRGPLKWRWLTEMLAKLSKAAGILSPDGSVQINPTTGGVTLYTPPTATTAFLAIEQLGPTSFKVPELTVDVAFISSHTLIEQVITVPQDRLLCIAVEYSLTSLAWDEAPNFNTAVLLEDIDPPVSVSLQAVNRSTFEAAQAALPRFGSAGGLVYIPIAVHEQRFVVLASASTAFSVSLFQGQHQFTA